MEKRKLQATGGSSLTLTLPKAWVDGLDLKSKDEVLVSGVGPMLIIKPASQSRREITIEITIDQMADEWFLREIIGAYIAGADKIVLRSQRITPGQNQAVRNAIQRLFGFEILEETSRKIVAKTIIDDAMFPVSESTLRTFAIARSMFMDALKAAQTGDKDLATDIKQRDYEVNKFLHAIQRQFQEISIGKVDGNLGQVNYYRSVAVQLERIGDHAVKIAELAGTGRTDPAKLSGTFPVILKAAERLLKDTESMVRHLDKKQAHRILDTNKELESLIYSSKRMKQSYEGAILGRQPGPTSRLSYERR